MSMENLEFYIPEDIPPEVLAYGSVLSQLGVGKAGKVGAIVLKLEYDPGRQKTVAKEQYSKVPLYTQRVLYLEESLPSMAYMYIMSPSGGILQGDRYRMDITLKNDAFFHLKTSAKNQNGDLRFIDIALLEPKKRNIKNFGVLEDFDVVGTVYILSEEKYIRGLNDQINSMIESLPKIYGGATILPNNSGVMVRLLGPFAGDVRNVIYEIVRISRKVILNAEFSAIRKG